MGRERMNPYKEELAKRINPENETGDLAYALNGADVFVGVSQPNLVSPEMVSSMADQAIVFALSNPTPEIMPDLAAEAGAAVVATGRSDFSNQVNNVLAFPGIFKGALEARLSVISRSMLVEAAHALSKMVPEPNAEKIMPSPFDPGVAEVVAEAVKRVA